MASKTSPRPSREAPGLGVVVLTSAITSAVVCSAILFGTGLGGTVFSDPITVRDLTGMSRESAAALLESQGLRLVVAGEQHDDAVPVGQICQQQPLPDSQLRRGDAVTVMTSLGEEQVVVPDLTGRPLDVARRALPRARLRVGAIERGGEGEPNTVVSTRPEAGEEVSPGSRVVIVATPERRLVAVPDVVGRSIREARETVTAAGLTVGRVRRRFDGDRPAFRILSQTPEAGTEVEPGAEVELVMNEE